MSEEQYWQTIHKTQDQLNHLFYDYWKQYSDFGNWQFWAVLALAVLPLVLLCFTVDRKRIFELFFFGYTVHILWTYIDIALGRSNHLTHAYFLIPILPNASNITASVLPVGFLLLYQYCTKHSKNFYIYTIIVSALFAFGLAPLEKSLGLIEARKSMNLFYVFLIDLGIVYFAYWITKWLLNIQKKEQALDK